MKPEYLRKISLAVVWPAFVFIVLFATWMVKQHFSQPELANAILFPEDSRSIQSFSLVDHNDKIFGNERLLGKWTFIFFGYTYCPDICPLTLQTLDRAAGLIEEQGGADVQFIFVSVDPRRDSSIRLKNYVTYFNPGFLGLSGEHRQLLAFGSALDAPFDKVDKRGSGSYIVTHSAQIFLVSPKAERFAMLPQPHQAGDIARDFYVIQSYYKQDA